MTFDDRTAKLIQARIAADDAMKALDTLRFALDHNQGTYELAKEALELLNRMDALDDKVREALSKYQEE